MVRGRGDERAPYFVAMREYERRLLLDALREADGVVSAAANMLGVTSQYIYIRATHLGGIFEGEPKNEPPGPIAKTRRKVRSALYRQGHDEQRNGDDPVHGIRGDPEGTP